MYVACGQKLAHAITSRVNNCTHIAHFHTALQISFIYNVVKFHNALPNQKYKT